MKKHKTKILSELNSLSRSMHMYFNDYRQIAIKIWAEDVDKLIKYIKDEIN